MPWDAWVHGAFALGIALAGASYLWALLNARGPLGSLRLLLLVLALCAPTVHPWYLTWLLPLGLAPQAAALRPGLALYTALAPALYLTGAAGAFAIVFVQGSGLLVLLRPAATARSAGPPVRLP